jgi:hypothetical protein
VELKTPLGLTAKEREWKLQGALGLAPDDEPRDEGGKHK